jgi:hypothetical protein
LAQLKAQLVALDVFDIRVRESIFELRNGLRSETIVGPQFVTVTDDQYPGHLLSPREGVDYFPVGVHQIDV